MTASGGVGTPVAPIPATDSPGIYHYWVTQTMGGCESERVRVTIMILEKADAPLVQDVAYCEGSIAPTLIAQGQNLLWYTSAEGGTGSATTPIPTSYIGTQMFWVSQQIGGCESERAKINWTIHPKPAPPTITNPNPIYCESDVVAAPEVIGENLLWYARATGGIGQTQPVQMIATVGFQDCWVSQTINGCESERTPFSLTILKTPTPRIGRVIVPSSCGQDGSILIEGLDANRAYELSYRHNDRTISPYIITTNRYGTHTINGLAIGDYTDIKLRLGYCTSMPLTQTLDNGETLFTAELSGATTICRGDFTVLSLKISGGVAPFQLTFTNGHTNYKINTYNKEDGIFVVPFETATYTLLSLLDGNGCEGVLDREGTIVTVVNCGK